MNKLPAIKSASEILAKAPTTPAEELRKLKYFRFNKRELMLTVKSNSYPIVIKDCNTSARLLDTILQMNSKPWFTPAMLKELIDAIEYICELTVVKSAQGTFCLCGIDQKVTWKKPKGS